MADPYENLANAIVLQAVKDYRDSKKKLKKHPNSEEAKRMIKDVTRFLLSDWLTALTTAPGKLILKKLEQEE